MSRPEPVPLPTGPSWLCIASGSADAAEAVSAPKWHESGSPIGVGLFESNRMRLTGSPAWPFDADTYASDDTIRTANARRSRWNELHINR